MEFTNLHNDCNCNCVEGAEPDTTSHYVIKTMKNVLREQDFKTNWDKEERSDDCTVICSLKGKSVSSLQEEVRDIYKQLFPISPKYKPYFSVIKFNENSGVLQYTPNEINKYHYDFFKCDTFVFTQVELIESTLLD